MRSKPETGTGDVSDRLIVMRSTDPSEYEAALRPWELLCQPTESGHFDHRLKLLVGDRFMLYREDYALSVNLSGMSPAGLLMLCVPARRTSEAVYWSEPHALDRMPCSLPGEASAFLPAGYAQLVAGIRIEALRRHVSPELLERLEGLGGHHVIPRAPETRTQFGRWLASTLDRVGREPLLAGSRAFRQRCFDDLIAFLPGLVKRPAADGSVSPLSRSRRGFQRALEYLREAPLSDIRLSRLCEVSGVSERSLQYAFRDALGMSPKAFMTVRRLHAVRRTLVGADPAHTRISDVATRYGFFELGRFSGYYRKRFGERPTDTLRRAR